jgi:hypothetical protein
VTEQTLPTEPDSYELRVLDPKRVRIFQHAGLTRMTLEGDRSWVKVSIVRALPISDPDRYYGVLDGNGNDIGLIVDPGELDEDSQRVVAEHLELRYFTPVVERVLSVKEEFGTVYWTFQTTRGVKDVVARNLRDNLQELTATRVLLTDVDGNRYEFPDINQVDPQTLSIILRHL